MSTSQHPVVKHDPTPWRHPVFAGTRVPIQVLVDYLEMVPLSDFLEDYPSVSHEQAVALLQLAKDMLLEYARSA